MYILLTRVKNKGFKAGLNRYTLEDAIKAKDKLAKVGIVSKVVSEDEFLAGTF